MCGKMRLGAMGMHWALGFVHRGKRDGGCTQSRTLPYFQMHVELRFQAVRDLERLQPFFPIIWDHLLLLP